MSTKTTFKRVALVAVAALSLGVISVAPSSAVVNADSLTLSSATATQTTGETKTATSATVTLAFLAGVSTDSMSVTASLVSGPAGSTALPYLALAETTSATIDTDTTAQTDNSVIDTVTAPNVPSVVVNAAAGAANVAAKYTIYLGTSATAAPSVAGTYVVKLTPANTSSGSLNATAQTLTITVTKSTANTATGGTAILNRGETNTATTDDVVTASKDATSVDAAASIVVALTNSAGGTPVESYTATLTGPGTLGAEASNDLVSTNTKLGRSILVKYNDVVQVWADGSSGVAKVTISTASGVVIATKEITFYGDATTITANTTALLTGTVAKANATTNKLITFKVADAAGTAVTTGKYYLVSADTTKISNTYTECNAWNATDGYTCNVTGVAKGSTTVYVTNKPSATDTTVTTVLKSADVTVRVGSQTPASVSVAFDKSSYAPGEKATISVTIKDADGNVVPSDTYTAIFATDGIVSTYSFGTSADAALASTDVIGTVDGVKAHTVYMPVTEGDVKISWTTGTTAAGNKQGLAVANQDVDGSIIVSVSSPGTAAALDAANEATDAANAATDAALAAADAADAATAAAEDASSAVAKLAKSVNTQLKALKKQLTNLIALVNKLR